MELLKDKEYPSMDEFTELEKYVGQLQKRIEGLESALGDLLGLLSTEGVMDAECQLIIKNIEESL